MMFPLALLAVAFIHECTALRCTFASTGDVGTSYKWEWGNGKTETHTGSTVSNTWSTPGTYQVKLTVSNAKGIVGVSAQAITVPSVTGVVYDTVRIVHTDTIRLAGRVDTIRIVTIVNTPPPPVIVGRVVISPTPLEFLVYQNGVFIGQLIPESLTNSWYAYQYIVGQTNMLCLGMATTGKCNAYSSQLAARDALP